MMKISHFFLLQQGRHLLLGTEVDQRVQIYLNRVRNGGGVVTARIAIAAARGVLLSYNRSRLAKYGGQIELNLHWAYGLL